MCMEDRQFGLGIHYLRGYFKEKVENEQLRV